ncbi:hypothetical protein AKJ52_01725 [candidate division MSBL1 archaeon SCGC-AAA382C18]|uniref:Transposase IS4-like domain-containing protein n=1 Tax=candidate division MSBL1 archaeon SCGC-AAA382C18 TaxID=1698281 RepID=A0A133VJY7_9EURY|nr:hypothetical protein AKJ52_01725 [candidate division MSBL1 archaeon SCGC-AAA382C18]
MYLVDKEIKGNKYWYLEETEWTEDGPRKAFSLYLGKPERIHTLVTDPLGALVLSTHTFGTTAALLHGVEELGLGEVLSEELSLEGRAGMSPAQRLVMVLGARYERSSSKLDTVTDWYGDSVLPFLWKCNVPHVNTVYGTMDSLTSEVREKVKDRLRGRLFEMGFEPERLVWDTTNFHTYGDDGGLRRKGRSKDGKHGCPLVGLGVLTSEEDIPLTQVVFPGNRHDKKVFERSLPSLLNLVEEVSKDPKDITLVFDRGCNDEDLIQIIEETTHCVGKLKRNQDPGELLQTPVDKLDHLYTTEKDYEVRGLKTEGEVFGKTRSVTVMWHEGTARKKTERLQRLKEGALEACRDLEERVGSGGRGRNFTSDGIQRALKQFKEISDALDWTFNEKGQSFEWEFEEDEWKRLLNTTGKSLLFTTRKNWDAKQVIKAYEGKWKVEKSFRLLKGPVPLRPIFHWEENRIYEHCFLIFLLLMIHRFLMEKIRKPVLEKFEIGEEAALHLLKNFDLVMGKKSDSNKPSFSLEKPDEIQEEIINTLDLKRFIPE